MPRWSYGSKQSKLHLLFYDLVETLVVLLLSADKTFDIIRECRMLLACEDPQIPLFNEDYINKLVHCQFPVVLKMLLLPFMTWFDHSILRHLVMSSRSNQAERMLNHFTSLIDDNQPINFPASSQLIIPLDESDYTLVATKISKELTIKQVAYIKQFLLAQWGITKHAIQLTAVHVDQGVLYWMIPESVAPLIESHIDKYYNKLRESGISTSAVLSKQSLFSEQRGDMEECGLFCYLNATNASVSCNCCDYM